MGGFVQKHQAEIVGAVAGGLATAGCLAATGGVGSVGCFIAGGAVGGAVTNLWRTQVQKSEEFSWGGLARDVAVGGVLGGAGGVVAKVVARVVAPAVVRAVQAVSNGLRNAARPAAASAQAARTPLTLVKAPAASPTQTVTAARPGSAVVKYKEWPDADGFLGGYSKETTLRPGTRIDRYGSNRGSFASPEDTPFGQRGLPGSRSGDPYSVFTVQKPITVRGGIAAAWGDSGGGAVQYKLPKSVQSLIDEGYLR